jgi:hypothetical protein
MISPLLLALALALALALQTGLHPVSWTPG